MKKTIQTIIIACMALLLTAAVSRILPISAAETPADEALRSMPVITGIASTDSGLQITYSVIPGADRYVLYRSDETTSPRLIMAADASDAGTKVLDTEASETTSVIPASAPNPQVVFDENGTITGYVFTDSLILPGKEYRYYVIGYHTASGQWSAYDQNGTPGTWNVTAAEISAGTQLTAEAVEQMEEAPFFYTEEISDDTFARMWGNSYKEDCTVPREDLRYIRCLHRNIDGQIKVGELVMSAAVADQVCEIFRQLYEAAYPIESMLLVDEFQADDEDSILHNNTSAFNYRTVDNTDQISDHAYGLAIDINPYYNVYWIPSENYVFPEVVGWEFVNARNEGRDFPYQLSEGDLCYRLFQEAGFSWGGYFTYNIDYQHFYYTDG